jgi:hypothetical protein
LQRTSKDLLWIWLQTTLTCLKNVSCFDKKNRQIALTRVRHETRLYEIEWSTWQNQNIVTCNTVSTTGHEVLRRKIPKKKNVLCNFRDFNGKYVRPWSLDPHFLTLFSTFWTTHNTIQKKILVSVSLDLVTHHRNVVKTSFWCQNAGNFYAKNWLDFGFKSQWPSWSNPQKMHFFDVLSKILYDEGSKTEVFSTKSNNFLQIILVVVKRRMRCITHMCQM